MQVSAQYIKEFLAGGSAENCIEGDDLELVGKRTKETVGWPFIRKMTDRWWPMILHAASNCPWPPFPLRKRRMVDLL